jgi:hypothetical protein
MNNKCSQKCASPGMSSYQTSYVSKCLFNTTVQVLGNVYLGNLEGTHWVMQMANSHIQTRSSLVGLRIMHQHSLQAIIEPDQPILAVILLRLLYRFGIDPVRRCFLRRQAAPVLNILWNPDMERICRNHSKMSGYKYQLGSSGGGRKERTGLR